MTNLEQSPVRYAAKGVLVDSNDRVLMLRGTKTKRWTIAGGGWKNSKEQLTDGFYREAFEETGLLPKDIKDLKPAGFVEGPVDEGSAFWYLYKGSVVDDHTPVVPGHDIDSIQFMTLEEVFQLKNPRSELAQQAIRTIFS